MEKIKEKILSMQSVFANSRVDLSEGSVDAQTSTNSNIVLVVTGVFYTSGATNGRTFFQTFFLENQTTDNHRPSYFVKNSIFRLISPLGSTDKGAKEYANASVSTLSTLESVLPSASATTDNIPHPIQPPSSTKKTNPYRAPAKETVNTDSATCAPALSVTDNTSEDAITAAKEEVVAASNSSRSYLDMLKKETPNVVINSKDKKEKQQKEKATVPVASTVTNGVNIPDDKSDDTNEATNSNANPILGSEKRNRQQRNSVYVNYIPVDVTRDAISKIFSKFGPVSYCDYVTNRGFAFVEYNNPDTVKEVVESTAVEPIVISGFTLKVERRNGKGNGTNKEINAKIAAAAEAAQKSTTSVKTSTNNSLPVDQKKSGVTNPIDKDSIMKSPKDKQSTEKKDNSGTANKSKTDNPIKSNYEDKVVKQQSVHSVNKSGAKTHSENK